MHVLSRYGFLVFSFILTIWGYICLRNSVDKGMDSAHHYLSSVGGSMDTSSFQLLTEGYILSNILYGSILLAVGLLFLCLNLYKMSFKNWKV